MPLSILMIFVDGVGIGKRDAGVNPFELAGSNLFCLYQDDDGKPRGHDYLENGWIRSLECTMGVDGLPQSASGQTALFTGRNTAKLLGKHLSGFPTRELKELLRTDSIMVNLEREGRKVIFANAFTPPYFEREITRVSATTAMAEGCARRIRSFEDMEKDGAVFMDLTNKWLIEHGYWVTPRTVEEAGVVLAGIARENDFTLFEYFITDVMGHRGDMADGVEQVKILDRFIGAVWENMDHQESLLIITSDHGNIEDMTQKMHTYNRIPLITAGKFASEIADRCEKITDVTPAIQERCSRYF